MSIASIMTKRVVSVHMDDSLHTLRELFSATGFHHLLVVHENKLVGVISDRDLLKAVSPFLDTLGERSKDRATLDKKAHQIMTREVISLPPHGSIVKAISMFNEFGVSCLPIVDENDHPVGIVSWRDVMSFMESRVAAKKV